jgi:5-methylcytosine-specific restriction endonuclease McrA
MNLEQRKKKVNSKYWRNKSDKELRPIILKRDGYKCSIEGCENTDNLHLHHILPKEHYAYLRHTESNCIILCPSHHKFGGKSAHKNALWFTNWLSDHRPTLYWSCLEAIDKKTNPKHNYKENYERLTGENNE